MPKRISKEEYKFYINKKYPHLKINWNEYDTAYNKINICCKYHGNIKMRPYDLYYGYNCRKCGLEEMSRKLSTKREEYLTEINKIHNNKYKYDLPEYFSIMSKINVFCKEHGKFTPIANNHKVGSICPICSKKSSIINGGFSRTEWVKMCKDRNKDSFLYIIKGFDEKETFIKVGITTRNIKYRLFNSSFPYKYEVLRIKKLESTRCWNLEKALIRRYKNIKYIPLKDFKGKQECFKTK